MNSALTSPTPATTNNANLQSIGLILISVAFGAVGQLLFKAALNSLGVLELSVDMFVRMATNPLLLAGGGIFVISTLLWLLALSKADLSFAYPFLSLTYFAVLLGGALLFNEQITLARVGGFAVVIVGLLVVARGEQSKSA